MENMELEIIDLVDDEGNEMSFEILMSFEHKENIYIALCDAEAADDEEIEVRIMRVEEEEDGEDAYVDIEDEAELDEVFQVFQDIMEQDA